MRNNKNIMFRKLLTGLNHKQLIIESSRLIETHEGRDMLAYSMQFEKLKIKSEQLTSDWVFLKQCAIT